MYTTLHYTAKKEKKTYKIYITQRNLKIKRIILLLTTCRDSSTATLHTSLVNMSPRKEDPSRCQDSKQLYSKLKKLKQRYKDLERKHAILKTMHAHVKQELKVARQVDTGIYISI